MPTLSVCLIMRNEQKNLPKLLANVEEIADEIIVVDTGSTDKSKKIAMAHPKVKLFHKKWQKDFSAARNESLAHATSDWILVLDADEVLQEPAQILDLLTAEEIEGYHLRIRNLQPKGSLTNYEDSHLLRLFRNREGYRYEGLIHEQISPSIGRANGKVEMADLLIVHHGYVSDKVQGSGSRRKRNLELLNAELKKNPDDFYYLFHMGLAFKVMDPKLSEEYFLQALEKGKDQMNDSLREQSYMRLTQLTLQRHDNVQAIQYAKKSLEINPMNLITRVCLVTAYVAVHGFAQAIPHLEIIVAQKQRLPNPTDFVRLLQLCQQQLAHHR